MNKFLIGVADVWLYADAQCTSLIATAKTMTNNTIDVTNTSVDIQGGKGNKLLKRFFTSAMANVTLTDTRFDLSTMAANWGQSIAPSFTTRKQEAVTLNSSTGTITGTPVGVNGGSPLVYIEYNGETMATGLPVSNKTFTIPSSWNIPVDSKVCASYFAVNTNAKYITIPANIIPKTVYAVFEANLASSEAGEGVIGRATIIIPSLQLSGNQSISLTSDGYATQDLSGTALAFTPIDNQNPCLNEDIYGYIVEEIYDTNWWDETVALIVPNIRGVASTDYPVVIYNFNGQYSYVLSDEQVIQAQTAGVLSITAGENGTYTESTNRIKFTQNGTFEVELDLSIKGRKIITEEGSFTVVS